MVRVGTTDRTALDGLLPQRQPTDVGGALVGCERCGIPSPQYINAVGCADAFMIVNPKTTNCSSFEDTEAPSRRDPGSHRVVDHPVRCHACERVEYRLPELWLMAGDGNRLASRHDE
jgi:hypothetical protein